MALLCASSGLPKRISRARCRRNFNYRPLSRGGPGRRIYVLADGIYEGLLEFDVDGNFRGFLGAPLVRPTILERFWAKLATREQRKRMVLFLPTEYTTVDLDERGFLYVAEFNQIRRLNPSGTGCFAQERLFRAHCDVPPRRNIGPRKRCLPRPLLTSWPGKMACTPFWTVSGAAFLPTKATGICFTSLAAWEPRRPPSGCLWPWMS